VSAFARACGGWGEQALPYSRTLYGLCVALAADSDALEAAISGGKICSVERRPVGGDLGPAYADAMPGAAGFPSDVQ
jgi:hypothetical protein